MDHRSGSRTGVGAVGLAACLAVAMLLAPAVSAQSRVFSPTFSVDGLVQAPRTFTIDDLQSLPAQSVDVEFASGNTREKHTYRGPLLVDVLNATRPMFDASKRNDNLRWFAVVHATDGYEAVIAWGEIDPGFGAKKVLVAYEADGKPLADADGMARLVVPGDQRGGRYVSQIDAILVRPAELAVGK